MNSFLIGFASVSFVAQFVMLFGAYLQNKPKTVLVARGGYLSFWTLLAAVEFFELHTASYGLVVLLAILLPLTVVSFRRQRRDERTQSA